MTIIEAVPGDLTVEEVDAVVNAANSTLLGGGGVDGAIHRAGGPEILEACRELRRTVLPDGLPTGEAVVTTAGRMPARWVVHTVGPVYGANAGRDAELLASCHRNALLAAHEVGARTLALPAISCGVYGYPVEEAAPIAVRAVQETVASLPGAFDAVRFVLIEPRVLAKFLVALASPR
ncbi:MAG TPA: O-acetyl-ADP-ribose deacetylase [Candidatus Nanopelagicales bacterium]|nr:O-acetyl-ADP-ribose deacetylase [Candidatus Nanopelagicales bacterium]